MASEVNLKDAVDSMRSGLVTHMRQGLADFRHVLEFNRRKPDFKEFKDPSLHASYEALFHIASVERNAYLKTKTDAAASRLEPIANTMRDFVDLTVRMIRLKTLKAIMGHIVQTLPVPGGGFCDPLSTDYIKAFRKILEYPPHVEHLSGPDWLNVVDFCLNGINDLSEEMTISSNSFSKVASGSQDSNGNSGRFASYNARNESKLVKARRKMVVLDLMICLHQLVSATNCPLSGKVQEILACVFGFLQASSSTTSSHPSAMAVISCTLSRISITSLNTTYQILEELFSVPTDSWQLKDTALWDEMLLSLIHGKAHLMKLVEKDDQDDLVFDVEALFEKLYKYLNNLKQSGERTFLELHDFTLATDGCIPIEQMPLQVRSFGLRNSSVKSERNWTTLHLLAFLASWVDYRKSLKPRVDQEADGDGPRQRRRVSSKLDELLDQCSDASTIDEKISGLQIVAFYLHQKSLDVSEVESVLRHLVDCMSHSSVLISSWAMIGLASCALQPSSKAEVVKETWITIWQVAVRLMSSAGHSRAACHLLKILLESKNVKYSDVAESVENTFFASMLNGPALLSDSALDLWLIVLHDKLQTNPSGVGRQNFEQMLGWIFNKWNPGHFEDRSHMYQISSEISLAALGRLFNVATKGSANYPPTQRFVSLETFGLAFLKERRNRALKEYLLLLKESDSFSLGRNESNGSSEYHIATSFWNQGKVDDLIITFVTAEIENTMALWKARMSDRPVTLTKEIATNLLSICLIGDIVAENTASRLPQSSNNLTKLVSTFAREIIGRNSRTNYSLDVNEALLETMAPFLPDVDTYQFSTSPFHCPSTVISEMIAVVRYHDEQDTDRDHEPALGSDDLETLRSPQTRSSGVEVHEAFVHSDVASQSSRSSFYASIRNYILLISLLNGRTDENSLQDVSTEFYQHLIALPPKDLIASQNILKILLSPEVQPIPTSDRSLLDLVEHLTDGFLENYEYERSEVTMKLCLSVMHGTVRLWSDKESEDLFDAVAELYIWFIDKALHVDKASGARIASPQVQVTMVDLLFELLELNAEYAQNLKDKPSVRTTLFGLLKGGELPAQYHIAKQIPKVFSYFVLSQHEAIFDDIRKNLSEEEFPIEGMLLRLFVLSRVAIAWKNLLRACVYYIFEVGAEIQQTVAHAGYCMADVSQAYELDHPRQLFKLFCPQILYTWFESSHKLGSIPPSIFGCASLQDLLRGVVDEVVAQVVMIGPEDHIQDFETSVGVSYKDFLTTTSFAKSAAYAFARDLADSRLGAPFSHQIENGIRNLIGKSSYSTRLAEEFAPIFGHLLMTLDQEDSLEKTLSKKQELAVAAALLRRIKKLNSSTEQIPPSQQPSFRSKHMLGALERLCRRTSKELISIWSPNLVLTVARMLFSDVNTVFGPIHARRVVQRVRILVSLAGRIACEGYPLERLLHGLRPFLTESMCSEDALGVFQYLVEEGKVHLSTNPSFLIGTSLATLLSIRHFMKSNPDSTTQESYHRKVLSKSQAFHTWLGSFVSHFGSILGSDYFRRTCNRLLIYGQQAMNIGNAIPGTAESSLLLIMLEDRGKDYRVLDQTSYKLCLRYLLQDFRAPLTFREDCLGDEAEAAKFGSQIWETCHFDGLSKAYKTWAIATLGRSFSYRGQVPEDAFAETSFKTLTTSPNTYETPSESRSAIVSSLADSLLGENASQVGLLEETLSLIIAQYQKIDGNNILDSSLSKSVASALTEVNSGTVSRANEISGSDQVSECLKQTGKPMSQWISDLTIALCLNCREDAVLFALPQVLKEVDGMAERLFPYVLHLSLLSRLESGPKFRQEVSQGFNHCLAQNKEEDTKKTRVLINSILYLRDQIIPQESTELDRDRWLEIDFNAAAFAARTCKMFKTALMFIEMSRDVNIRSSRRSSMVDAPLPNELLLSIFTEIDEPDSFYGVQQPYNLSAVADRLDYEGNASEGLLLRGAQFDSLLRRGAGDQASTLNGVIGSLTKLNLNSLSHQLLTIQQGPQLEGNVSEGILKSAMKLRQWDVATSFSHSSNTSTLYRVFQDIHSNISVRSAPELICDGLKEIFDRISDLNLGGQAIRSSFASLAALNEMQEVLSAPGSEQALEATAILQRRDDWMESKPLEDVAQILTVRDTLFGMLSNSSPLQESLQLSPSQARMFEVEVNLKSSTIYRKLGALQESLGNVAYLTDIVEPCRAIGVNIDGAVSLETANILWERKESIASIKMLQSLSARVDFSSQSLPVDKAVVLATTGRYVASAHLERSDEILNNYLLPSLEELRDRSAGLEAGQVFHDFAMYCNAQLENPDFQDEFRRNEKFRYRKHAEVRDLQRVIETSADEYQIKRAKSDRNKAKILLSIDEGEYRRLSKDRQTLLQRSLDHYLLSLSASDEYDTDVLRFVALWLANSENKDANQSLSLHIKKVPSRKFVVLMNQLASRLQDTSDLFQETLGELVERICIEHPYHGMYHIFAGEKTEGGSDKVAQSRNSAAKKIANHLQSSQNTSRTWKSISKSNELYIELAHLRGPDKKDEKRDLKLGQFRPSKRVESYIPSLHVPPITMSIDLREDLDYGKVPIINGFKPDLAIASGLSAPKVITAITSDGRAFKQLYKSGSDDLRQDAIMEQVFSCVTDLLKRNKATRQRDLKIRTYNVIPLSATSGAIEFVPNSVVLNDWLSPAHEKYHPKDLKWNAARQKVQEAQKSRQETRVKTYKDIAARFSPVFRHFFFEYFKDPDEWFERRLAYTRSTAAISILGHALGLGDRHCQNILLDSNTGDVIHIDLGVAFEAGRILQVPEVVPFRLTRDTVDGFGIMKTEGVFRRCCEFTLEALRQNKDAIMTLLNVLRYDPLYSWTVSPLRAKQLQDEQEREMAAAGNAGNDVATESSTVPSTITTTSRSRRSMYGNEDANGGHDMQQTKDKKKKEDEDEGGEADRALTVVERKLATGLSVTATVNELIQQATDESNLAMLFCGWAAFA